MYQIDDSGSMMWDIMPDSYMPKGNASGYLFAPTRNNTVYGGANYASIGNYYLPAQSGLNIYEVFLRSSRNNAVYYNPNQTYKPWVDADGNVYAPYNAADNPKQASFNPAYQWADKIDLTSYQQLRARWYYKNALHGEGNIGYCRFNDDCRQTQAAEVITQQGYWPITFYVYKGSGSAQDRKNYHRYQIRNDKAYVTDLAEVDSRGDDSRRENEISQFPWGRSVAEEARNFAVWFQYYRSRILAAKASTALAFAELGTEYLVGFSTINGRSSGSYLPVPTEGGFTGTNRQLFFDTLLNLFTYQKGTPLRSALQWSGENFKNNYWNDGVSCRRAFTILTTDGYWSAENINVGNVDSFDNAPYPDTLHNTLADVAMRYWRYDLKPDLTNNIRPSAQNPAYWQHMTTFSLSLGLKGTLDPVADLPLLAAGSKSWPDPGQAEIHKIDDLLHAAVNTRGRFVAAANPDEFRQGLLDALNEITQMSGSQAAGGMSQQVYTDGALYFQAGFDSDNWTGSLQAFKLVKSGSTVTVGAPLWNAADRLSKGKNRIILMGGGGSGNQARPFTWSDLQAARLTTNLDSNLVSYLRGNGDGEGRYYRMRTTLLGDIVGSAPVYVGAPSAKLSTAKNRPAMVYVGANDGMLHAFDANTGEERFAYIPSSLLPHLKKLSEKTYPEQHRYYVDGLNTVAEATGQDDNRLATYLAGTLGRGGEAMYLLDITHPDLVREDSNAAASLLRWEFGSQHSAHMGKQHGLSPQILRLNDGKDYVLAPNGYNSKQGSASLFILPVRGDISSWSEGSNYWRLQAAPGGGNGLSDITPYDLDNNGTIDLVYAGDRLGNLWRFDLSAKTPSDWQQQAPSLLFTAIGPNGQPQPVMAAPVVAPHPDYQTVTPTAQRPGLMVYLGTGRYLDSCDQAGGSCSNEDRVQSIYGLWDYGGRICQRKELLPQYLSNATISGASSGSYRQVSDNKLAYPPHNVELSPCLDSTGPRTEMLTRLKNGNVDKRYPFPDFTKPQAERDASGGYWLGWYIDLPAGGERVVSALDYYKKRVEVQTYIPAAQSKNVCEVGKDSGYLLRLNYRNGGVFAKPRFDDELLKAALGKPGSSASRVVGKATAGSLGRSRIKSGNRFSLVLSLTSGGTGGELDEMLGRVVTRVSWREIVTP
ncbi:MAG: pilus assembly protein [Vogesella sp.]|uniref:pilus assembly protein n=1 Tax=Vogesella sp. TaxID=1904252 RepID=UPI00391CA9A4